MVDAHRFLLKQTGISVPSAARTNDFALSEQHCPNGNNDACKPPLRHPDNRCWFEWLVLCLAITGDGPQRTHCRSEPANRWSNFYAYVMKICRPNLGGHGFILRIAACSSYSRTLICKARNSSARVSPSNSCTPSFPPQYINQSAFEAGTMRIANGSAQLIQALEQSLAPASITNAWPVKRITHSPNSPQTITVYGPDDQTIDCGHLIIAAPPRNILQHIQFEPDLPPAWHAEAQAISTWMGHSGKCLCWFTSPFWREQGLSGSGFLPLPPLANYTTLAQRRASWGSSWVLLMAITCKPAIKHNALR